MLQQSTVAGISDWWEDAQRRVRGEVDKVRDFVRAVGEFQRQRVTLDGVVLKLQRLRVEAESIIDPEVRARMVAKIGSELGRAQAVQARGNVLAVDVGKMMQRTGNARREMDVLPETVQQLGGIWLVIGVGAGAAMLTGLLVAWIVSARAVGEGFGALRNCLDLIKRGDLTQAECLEIVQAAAPSVSLVGSRGAVASVLGVGALLWFLSTRGGR
jgi:hypothetical protein